MEEPITVTTTYNTASMMPAFRWHWKRRRWKFYSSVLFISISVIAVAWMMSGKLDAKMYFIAIGGIIGGVIGGTFARSRTAKRSVEKSPGYEKQFVWFFDDNGFQVTSEFSNSTTSWPAICETAATSDGILIYPQENIFFWLATSDFNSRADHSRLLDILAAKTKYSKIG
jgi:hypothetical protein